MTEQELLKELFADIKEVAYRTSDLDKRLRKKCIRHTVFPVYVSKVLISRRKNRWVLMQCARSKKMQGEDCIFIFACLVDTPRGIYTYFPHHWGNGAMTVNIYPPPHFFSRYAERMGLSETGVDLIKRFLRTRALGSTIYGLDGPVAHVLTDGLCLGVSTVAGSHLLKTFISNDMLKADQLIMAAESQGLLKKQYDELMEKYG